jgi:hypothetical protein
LFCGQPERALPVSLLFDFLKMMKIKKPSTGKAFEYLVQTKRFLTFPYCGMFLGALCMFLYLVHLRCKTKRLQQ